MMLRTVLFPLLLFTLSMACMGQTFQYSRGWTNGKRTAWTSPLRTSTFHHKNDNSLADIYDFQQNEHKLDRCLVQLQRFVGNALLHRSSLSLTNSKSNNNDNDNTLYNPSHHQSNELFEELNAVVGAAGTDAAEPNDYDKH